MVIRTPFGKTHEKYALKAGSIEGLYNNPVRGWIAGKDLSSEDIPKVYTRIDAQAYEDRALQYMYNCLKININDPGIA